MFQGQFLNIVFIVSALLLWGLVFIKPSKKKKPTKCTFQKPLDDKFQKYLDSLREGGRYEDYERAKKQLNSKE